MNRYTAKELKWLASLAVKAGADHAEEKALWDEHLAARKHAEEMGQPVQGVCPTMFRNPTRPPQPFGFDPMELASKLLDDARSLRQGKGPYRAPPTETELLSAIADDMLDTDERREAFERWKKEDRTLAGLLREGLLDIS